MKKTILALAAIGLAPLAAGAATLPGNPPPSPEPAPAFPAPRTTYGDVARVISSRPVYEKTADTRRECRMESTGYSGAASEIERCDDIADARERIVGYDVTYQYNGREFRIRMPYEPGGEIAVNVDVRPPLPRPHYNPRPRYRGPY